MRILRRWHVLLALVVLAVVTRPLEAARPPGAATLTGITVTRDGTFVYVSLRATAPLPPVTPERTNEGTPRIFLDVPGTIGSEVPARLAGAGPIARVRVAQNSLTPPVVRIVFDLTSAVSFGVAPSGPASNDLIIAIAAIGTDEGRPSLAAEATTPAPAPPASGRPTAMSPPAPAVKAQVSAVSPAAPAAVAAPAPAPIVTPPTTSLTPATTGTTVAATTGGATAAAPALPATAAQQTPPAPRPATGFGMGGSTPRPSGRLAVFASGSRANQTGGDSLSYGDLMTAVTYQFLDRANDGVEYGLDMRHTAYTITGRDPRVSVYNGFVGARVANGHAILRAGHLWLDDLGALGAVAGAQLEARSGPVPTSGIGRWRGGLFGGLDPNIYRFGYGEGVRKLGAYGVLEGARGRRHVAGYVNVHNGSMTERSVLSVANFVPAGPFYVYQAAEYDLSPIAGGRGHDGLTYLFANARAVIRPWLEVMSTVSRGRSVDARGLSDDIQAGRPVTQQALDGLRYESLGGRVTAEVLPRVRVYAGYSRDKNNRDDAASGRWLVGGFAGNVFHSGLDLTMSDSRMSRPTGSYHSTYVSAGRDLSSRVYATAEFSTALSQIRFERSDGIVVETRPSTKRFGGNATVQISRSFSSFVNVERTLDGSDYREWRALVGVTYRLR